MFYQLILILFWQIVETLFETKSWSYLPKQWQSKAWLLYLIFDLRIVSISNSNRTDKIKPILSLTGEYRFRIPIITSFCKTIFPWIYWKLTKFRAESQSISYQMIWKKHPKLMIPIQNRILHFGCHRIRRFNNSTVFYSYFYRSTIRL